MQPTFEGLGAVLGLLQPLQGHWFRVTEVPCVYSRHFGTLSENAFNKNDIALTRIYLGIFNELIDLSWTTDSGRLFHGSQEVENLKKIEKMTTVAEGYIQEDCIEDASSEEWD